MKNKIIDSLEKFNLNLDGLRVLTEAASGNYVVTPILAALSGANVTAITKSSKYATDDEVKEQTLSLAKKFNIEDKITVVTDKRDIKYDQFDVVTNTGFVRPIDTNIVDLLSSSCVIPLMWEPWEYRNEDLDLDACYKKGIKVYGTNESDDRLKTMLYIGYIALHFLLNEKKTPFSTKVLLLGNKEFAQPVKEILENNTYRYNYVNEYTSNIDIASYNVIIIAENANSELLIGDNGFIKPNQIPFDMLIIHICGNVEFSGLDCECIPKEPASFGYMSFTTDYIDNKAVIDLHTAGLKVAEGMIKANSKQLKGKDYKLYMESNYPSLSFDDSKYW